MGEETEHAMGVGESHHPHGHQQVRIHIDQRRYESPTPTSGEALYALAEIPAGNELFREVEGDKEDEAIGRDANPVHLKEDEHFHSSPEEFKIIVNARQKLWCEEKISYEQVVVLAYETPPTGPNIIFAVTYHKGPGHTKEGILNPGQSVGVKNGMVFDVTPTDRS
jgi:Multiubiquitin